MSWVFIVCITPWPGGRKEALLLRLSVPPGASPVLGSLRPLEQYGVGRRPKVRAFARAPGCKALHWKQQNPTEVRHKRKLCSLNGFRNPFRIGMNVNIVKEPQAAGKDWGNYFAERGILLCLGTPCFSLAGHEHFLVLQFGLNLQRYEHV